MRADLCRPGRRPSLLIVACGDVGLRVLRTLGAHWRVFALTSTPTRVPALRAAGAVPLVGDLDDPATLVRLGALADRVLHLAPPPGAGHTDPRTAALVRALWRGGRTRHFAYGSTSGVYGDCAGARIDETRAVAPRTNRARRRVDAEARLRHHGRAAGCTVTVLRVPGLYALDRAGGDPRERLRRGLPRPPCVAREAAVQQLGPMAMSFLGESRRLDNTRLRRELRVRLRYPTVREALGAAPGSKA